MSLCHSTNNLIARGRSKRKGRPEYLYTCKVCGGKWQWSKESGYYQVKKKSDLETKTAWVHLRVTKKQKAIIDTLKPEEKILALLESAERKI